MTTNPADQTLAASTAVALSEQERKGLLQSPLPMWLKVRRPDLISYHENTFGNYLALTALGRLVRATLAAR